MIHHDDKNESVSPCPSPLQSRVRKTSSSSSSSSEVLPNLTRSRGGPGSQRQNKVGSLWDDSSGAEASESDSDEDEGFRGRNHRRGVGPPPASGGHGGLGQKKGIISPNAVLVKKDNVLRGLLFADTDEPDLKQVQGGGKGPSLHPPKRDAGYSFDYKDDDDDDGAIDDEDFAMDRKSRHEFMRSEQKDRDSNKHKQKQLMTFSQVSDEPTTSAARSSLLSSHSQKSADTDTDIQESSINLSECIAPSDRNRDSSISGSGKQLSEVATRSLGFDLKGSLAAINQWVDDQDSEDEEEEEETAVVSSKYGDVWSMRNEMKRATTAQKKILSRDKILGMCTGNTTDGQDPRSRLTADNLAMNEYDTGGGGYSYDQDDDDDEEEEEEESDCEENSVMFYDNNVDKTTNSLSKSCSLLTIGGFGDVDVKKSQKEQEAEKKLMSMSLQVNKPPKASVAASPRASKKGPKRENSKKSVTVENEITEDGVDSRGCTPSTSMQDVPRTQASVGAPTKSTLESDVRNSPSSDARERDVDKSSRAKKKTTTERVKIEVTKEGVAVDGAALVLSDEQLVHMLSQPPKAVPTLKTKSGFQDFFRGMPTDRMRQLLEAAYREMTDLDRDNKVNKRMELLSGVLTN